MVRSGLLIFLCLACPAFAQDAGPRMYQPPAPELVGYPNWVLTDGGKQRLDATLERHVRELEQLRTENASLRAGLVSWEAKPTLTWRGVLLLVGGGVVLGLAVGVPVALAVGR